MEKGHQIDYNYMKINELYRFPGYIDRVLRSCYTLSDKRKHFLSYLDNLLILFHLFQAQGEVLQTFKSLQKKGYLNVPDWSKYQQPKRWTRHRKKKNEKFHSQGMRLRVHPNRIDTLIRYIREEQGLPCIYFTFARRRTEYLAKELMSFDFLNDQERTEIEELFHELCSQYEITEEPSILDLFHLVKKGIAYHHAGMLPTVKEVIERLFTSKLIKLIFTTETFALGINMPAKSVVFDELRKYHGTHFGNLRTRDYYQMAGRAGRRGMDEQGFVYSRINPNYISHPDVFKVIRGKPEPVLSQFNAAYATLLNLYRQYQDGLFDIYPKSFHYFQASKRNRKRALDAIRRKLDLLKMGRYIEEKTLTPKGEFAACMYGYELHLTELMTERILDHLSVTELNIVLAALIFEPRKKDYLPQPTKNVFHLMETIEPIVKNIKKTEKAYRIWPLTKKPYFHLAEAVQAWTHGERFQNLQEWTSVDEGELVRYFRMVIQLLRIIREAPSVSSLLKEKTIQAIKLINRDEIDAEKQLRV